MPPYSFRRTEIITAPVRKLARPTPAPPSISSHDRPTTQLPKMTAPVPAEAAPPSSPAPDAPPASAITRVVRRLSRP